MSKPEPQSDEANVICPHYPEPEDYSEYDTEEECEKCGEKFILNTEFTVTHNTRPVPKSK